MTINQFRKAWRYCLSDISRFSRLVIAKPLRQYQLEPAQAILQSVLCGDGETFVVMMSRQAGKNELSAQLEAYLLNLYRRKGGSLVKASPTYKPQTLNSLLRLCDRLENPWNKGQAHRREGHIVELDVARAYFFSAEPNANVVGATASLLLEGDEAQDIMPEKWEKDFVPMGASTNVTTVLYGTAWTKTTFLARTAAYLKQLEVKDGRKRVFRVACDEVASEVPSYGDFVQTQVARLGRQHPLIKTQFYLETIDGSGGLFSQVRQLMMHGQHQRRHSPEPGHRYALLIDVGGEDENAGDAVDRAMLANPKRDATAVTVVDMLVDRSVSPPQRRYHTVDRALYLGTRHADLRDVLLNLVRHWHAVKVVIDATGVGAGLASFLKQALGDVVLPVTFTPQVKSDLGWGFTSLVETSRYADYLDDNAIDTRQFWYEVALCEFEIRPGPNRLMRWGVWESPSYNGLIAKGHDDLLVSASLCAVLDRDAMPLGDGSAALLDDDDALGDIDDANWM